MLELQDGSVELMVTSPPYPMIQMWDNLFAKADPKIAYLWQKMETEGKEETVGQITMQCMIISLRFGGNFSGSR